MHIDKVELVRAILGGIGTAVGLWAWLVIIIAVVPGPR